MTTTKELDAIVEELELIDIGDAASYLGEYPILDTEEVPKPEKTLLLDNCTGRVDSCASG